MWYLSFYCNPRVQLAVVSKILMEGLQSSASLYGEFIEQYVYREEELGQEDKTGLCNDPPFPPPPGYSVTSLTRVLLWQMVYSLLTPIIMLAEIGAAGRMAIIRDLGGRGKQSATVNIQVQHAEKEDGRY